MKEQLLLVTKKCQTPRDFHEDQRVKLANLVVVSLLGINGVIS